MSGRSSSSTLTTPDRPTAFSYCELSLLHRIKSRPNGLNMTGCCSGIAAVRRVAPMENVVHSLLFLYDCRCCRRRCCCCCCFPVIPVRCIAANIHRASSSEYRAAYKQLAKVLLLRAHSRRFPTAVCDFLSLFFNEWQVFDI